jgi:predicted nuclease of restriction endonuclease-like (RecB) superfamily
MKPLMPMPDYDEVLGRILGLLESARRASARSVNTIMTATYWAVGKQIVNGEQAGGRRAAYGEKLLKQLSGDLTARFGKGFSERNLKYMRAFYVGWPISQPPAAECSPAEDITGPECRDELIENHLGGIRQTLSAESANPFVPSSCNPASEIAQTVSAPLCRRNQHFPLPWSHYVKLLAVDDSEGRAFYETEALRGGWSVRQLNRQIASKFYERTLLSRNKAAMLRKGGKPLPGDAVSPEEEIKDPLVLEFLGLKDEYSETELEEALIRHLESFLLELGGDFAFVGRQRRLRIGNVWYRIDLLFFHRRLRCLLIIDLKLGELTHADAGQMHLYLNYAREHWMLEQENPPVGLILCSQKDDAVAHYALDGLPNKVLAAQYKMALPDEQVLIAELKRTQHMLTSKGTHP